MMRYGGRFRLVAIGIASIVALLPGVHAQGQSSQTALTFEVASVKPNKGAGIGTLLCDPGGRITITNMPLRLLIRNAYQLQDFQIVDAPSWTDSDRFDIAAKGDAETCAPNTAGQPGRAALMLRSLLGDRFNLKVHNEVRQLPIYALVLARGDRKLGSQLHPSSVDCAAIRSAARGAPPPLPAPGEPIECGIRNAPGRLVGGGNPISQLAFVLSLWTQRVVIDRTGLQGSFDFDLTWTPDQMPQGQAPPGVSFPPIDPNGPSIYTAVQEQLGLKLDSQKGPVDVLVIDSVEHPTED